ncbi:hypothetical protein niasHT_014312 [Heterodera trifolii]|uniref:Uncharacterized protein n=1 Tax=Heterodera trifolii TaxID=157864 RepID=A0ABD2L7Y0_9BILA
MLDYWNNKQYLEIGPDMWEGRRSNALVTFKLNQQQVIGQISVRELRKTAAINLMVKKRVYFPYFNGQGYIISAGLENGLEIFTAIASLDSSNNKRYLEIDPDQFGNMNSNDWIYFYVAGQQFYLGRATVLVLRQVSDIDFSHGVRNYGSLGDYD